MRPNTTMSTLAKPDIRRLARRGGVKRISATIYDDVRQALKERLETVSANGQAHTLQCPFSARTDYLTLPPRSSVTASPM
jgi:histone H4